MACPRCGAVTDERPECPRCGVVLAKAAAALARRGPGPAGAAGRRPPPAAARHEQRATQAPSEGGEGSRRRQVVGVVALVLLATAAFTAYGRLHLPRSDPRPQALGTPAEPPGPAEGWSGLEGNPEVAPPPVSGLLDRPAAARPPELPPLKGVLADGDALALAAKLRGRSPIGADEIATAERLYSAQPATRPLLVAVLIAAAQREHARRRYQPATELLLRATSLDPDSAPAWQVLLGVQTDAADWPAVERTALELQRLGAAGADTVGTLAYALVRQDRTREAIDLLTRELERAHDPQLASLLDRIRRDSGTEANLRQQTLSHFHVRYDGESHEDVGRELLRVLERHYATLVSTLDHEPADPIPVILLSREAYYDGTGAPAWSGGRYDSFDGRVRIPIGGLTTTFTPELEGTALHELTHAFVADRSRGVAPREVHEGLAQLMEGRRLSSLREDTLRALASGRAGGVGGYYLLSLAFVEDLVAQRGQGGVNDVLAAMASTGSVDAAFREVYGQDYQAAMAAAMTRLRSRYGG